MAIITKKIDGRKGYNGILSNEQIEQGQKLLEDLINEIPLIEAELKEKFQNTRDRIEYAHEYGVKLRELLNEHEVKEYQKIEFFQEIRDFASEDKKLPKDRSKKRNIFYYYYRISKFPLEEVKRINWSEWSQILDIPALSNDDQIIHWLIQASSQEKIHRDVFRELATGLRIYTNNKDLSFLSKEQIDSMLSKILQLSTAKFNFFKTKFTKEQVKSIKNPKKYREKFFLEAFGLLKNNTDNLSIEKIVENAILKIYRSILN